MCVWETGGGGVGEGTKVLLRREVRNTASRFRPWKPEVSTHMMVHNARTQTISFTT